MHFVQKIECRRKNTDRPQRTRKDNDNKISMILLVEQWITTNNESCKRKLKILKGTLLKGVERILSHNT